MSDTCTQGFILTFSLVAAIVNFYQAYKYRMKRGHNILSGIVLFFGAMGYFYLLAFGKPAWFVMLALRPFIFGLIAINIGDRLLDISIWEEISGRD